MNAQFSTSAKVVTTTQCRWCGYLHGMQCPAVKSIEFHADGVTIKRVEFRDPGPAMTTSWPYTTTSVFTATAGAATGDSLNATTGWLAGH